MGYANKKLKTEHNGAKHGNGAFYGRKQEAKEHSNKTRRQIDRALSMSNGQFDYEGEEWYEDGFDN